MREIKYRLRLDNEIVGYEKWYSGERAEVEPDTPGDLYWRASPGWLYSTDGKRWTPTFILHNHKDLFVNQLDKGAVEICEGDKVSILWHDIGIQTEEEGVVYWDDVHAGFYVEYDPDSSVPISSADFIEVIGNIYENLG